MLPMKTVRLKKKKNDKYCRRCYLGRMNANMNCCPICLLSLDPLNIDHKFLSVNLGDLAHLLSLVVTTDHLEKF